MTDQNKITHNTENIKDCELEAKLRKEYELFKEEFEKADSIAWKAVAEALDLFYDSEEGANT